MQTSKPLAIDTILIVEDDPFIAMDAVDAATNAGVNVVTADSVSEALALIKREHISAAILDFQVSDGVITPVVLELRRNGIPFRVVSGSPMKELAENGIPETICTAKPADYRRVVANLSIAGNMAGSLRH